VKKITQFLRNQQKRFVTGGGLLLLSGAASAASLVPSQIDVVFTDLGASVTALLTSAAILFGLIRGGTAVLKIASKFFGAAGA
jgi:hypothetical protein